MSSRIRWAILALAVVGLGLSLETIWVHYRLLTDPTYVSPCDVNATFNCSQLYLGPYGRVAGIPVGFGGVIWFGLVALIAGFSKPASKTSTAADHILGLSVIGLAVVAYLAYISFFVANTKCLLCLGTYACVIGIAALAKFATNGSVGRLATHLGRDIAALPSHLPGFGTGLVFLVAVIWAIGSFPAEGTMAQPAAAGTSTAVSGQARADFAAAWAQQPRTDLGIPAEGAAVVVVKFNDFECPTCRLAEQAYRPVLDRLEAAHPGAVRYVMKDYPLNSSCNFDVRQTIPGHEASCAAAAAGRLARAKGKFDEMTAWIWANQGTTPDAVRTAAMQILGVSGEEFDKAFVDAMPAVRQDVADGVALQITGTPTFFVNGVRLPDAIIPPQYFELAIQLEIEKAGAAGAAATGS